MPSSENDRGGASSPVPHQVPPQRPRTLFQRVSSSLLCGLPIELRRKLRDDDLRGTFAALNLARDDADDRSNALGSQPRIALQPGTPTSAEADSNCMYNPNILTSFASIEEEPCKFCGFNPFSFWKSRNKGPTEPCEHCRARSPSSHLANRFKRPKSANRSTSATQHRIPRHFGVLDGPRPVSEAQTASRIGNPPRRASLPSDRFPWHKKFHIPKDQHLTVPELHTDPHRRSSRSSSGSRRHPQPVSLKLHHLSLRSNPKVSFVHHSEVDQHIAALNAGAPSPLRHSIDSPPSTPVISDPHKDFSNTVFYGVTASLGPKAPMAFKCPDTNTVPRGSYERVEADNEAIIREGRTGGQPTKLIIDNALHKSHRYRRDERKRRARQTPEDPDWDEDGHGSLTTPSTVNGVRIELPPGCSDGLRGGGGPEGFRFMLKKWLLTCSVSCHSKYEDSEDDEPARLPPPEKFALAKDRGHGRASLPSSVSRSSPSMSPETSRQQSEGGDAHVEAASTTAARTSVVTSGEAPLPPQPAVDHIPKHRPESVIDPITIPPSPTQSFHSASSHLSSHILSLRGGASSPSYISPAPTPYIPTLRGGAGFPSSFSFDNFQRLPPTLYWLSGGRGKQSVTVGAWKQQKGRKKRFGGLLGMAVYGRKALPGYESSDEEDGDGG